MQLKATELADDHANTLCRNIMIIPKEVQFEALCAWVKGCRELHAIAFF